MTDSRGLYDKFIVRRTDGTDVPGEKHEGCHYFVLDLTHDPVASDVLPLLADAYETYGRHELAQDLRTLHEETQ